MVPAIIAPLLSQGLSMLANATLVKGMDWLKTATGLDLSSGVVSGPELDKLRQFSFEHEEELLKIQLENDKLSLHREQMYLLDIKSARDMQVAALNQEDKFAKRFLYLFTLLWSVACLAYVFLITFCDIPAANVRFADTILGFLIGSVLGQIFGFFYGTSSSSRQKDETIANAVKRGVA